MEPELLEVELIRWCEEEAFNRFSISFIELEDLIRWEEAFRALSIPVVGELIKQEEEFNRFSISFVELVLELTTMELMEGALRSSLLLISSLTHSGISPSSP